MREGREVYERGKGIIQGREGHIQGNDIRKEERLKKKQIFTVIKSYTV